MSRIGPMAMLTRAWEIAALSNSSMPARCLFFRRLQALLQIQFNRQVRTASGNHMNEGEIRMHSLRSLAGEPKNSSRIRVQTNGADPLPMFDRSGSNRLRVLRGQYRTISFVQYLRCCGTKQRPAEETSVCGHDVEIESVCVGEL